MPEAYPPDRPPAAAGKDRTSTARTRELGAQLRRVRERAGYSGAQLAQRLGWSPSRVSRLETGKCGVSELHVVAVLVCCGVRGKEFDDVLGLCRRDYDRSWLRFRRDYDSVQDVLVLHETTATRISVFEPLAIPDLLQTGDYASSLARDVGLEPAGALGTQVRAWFRLQALLYQERSPHLTLFVPERVLCSPVGGPRVMHDQLLHLVRASQPGCQLRVLPVTINPGGLSDGPFQLMEYSDQLPVAHIRNHTTSLFLEEPADVAIYRTVLDRLTELALDEEQSRQLLLRLASTYTPRPHIAMSFGG